MNTGVNTRELIVNILLEISTGEEYSHVLIRGVLEKYNYLDGKEKSFIKCVTEGCLERRMELDYILDGFSKTPVKKMKPFIRELLRMSVYQILYLSRVPDSAAINEAVKLAKKRGFMGLAGFVNGVLRRIAREGREYPLPDAEKEPVRHLSVKYSMPEWLVEKFRQEFGEERAERILQGLLSMRPVTIRFKRSVSGKEREELLAEMKAQGVESCSHPYLPEAYCLTGVEGVANLPGFYEGKFALQDISSMLAVEAAGIKPGDKVLDVCAAPGGKTAYAAMLTGESGHVDACDVTAYKTTMIEENCERLGLTNVSVYLRDATYEDVARHGNYDVVLADVPCLGLGVIGRKKEIKYRVKETDIVSITELQKAIVRESVNCVKPGGILLYSTCSMTREENGEMVDWMEEELGLLAESMEETFPKGFLDSLKRQESAADLASDAAQNFVQEPTQAPAKSESRKGETELAQIKAGRLQLLPGIHQSDGFFFARMRVKNG